MARQSRDLPLDPQSAPDAAVLLTRPKAQSRRFAAALAERFGPGLRVAISPLMVLRVLPAELPPGPFAGIVLTSEAGAMVAGAWNGLPRRAWCVGDRTAAAARAAGFDAVSAQGDAGALIARILASGERGPLLHLRGQDSRGDVAARLSDAGIPTAEAVVYAQAPQPPTAEAHALLTGSPPVVLPLFSPRSALLFRASLAEIRAPLHVAAISPDTADAAHDLRPARLITAARPDAEAMLDAVSVILCDLPAT